MRSVARGALTADAAAAVPVVVVRTPLHGLRATYLLGRLYVARARTAAGTASRIEAARAELARWLAVPRSDDRQ